MSGRFMHRVTRMAPNWAGTSPIDASGACIGHISNAAGTWCINARSRAAKPGSGRWLDDLPEGVLLDDQPVAEGPQVAAADLEAHAIGGGAGQGPLGSAAVAGDEVIVLAVVHVRDAGEAGGQALAHGGLALEPPAGRGGGARREGDGVIGEEGHDRVQVVAIERVEDCLEGADGWLSHGGCSVG